MSLVLPLLLLANPSAEAQRRQARYPSVKQIIEEYDKDKDKVLTSKEVAKSRYARQFTRWDTNGDKRVSAADIIAFRKRFGIAADGTMLLPAFTIPDVEQLARLEPGKRISREMAQQSAFVLGTRAHPTIGQGYFILTDYSDKARLKILERLAKHRQGEVVKVKSLASLPSNDVKQLQAKLQRARFVAIAPRLDTFGENGLLGVWQLLATLDDDREIDVFPGLLLASSAESLAQLVDQSINHQPMKKSDLRPFAISQVQRAQETRSLQKAGILRKLFAKSGQETPVVALYGKSAVTSAPKLDGKKVWNLTIPSRGQFIKTLPTDASDALNKSNLVIMHGHGIPGMSCSFDVDGIPADFRGKLLLTGSCFSAYPKNSDLPRLKQAPGGYAFQAGDTFVQRAVDRGALMAFGHQRLSLGFPDLYPVLDNLLHGKTVGESYQQLINAVIRLQSLTPDKFVLSDDEKSQSRIRQNRLLYIIVGDPALRPIAAKSP